MTEPTLESLRVRAEARRADGTYPPGIDDALRDDVARRLNAAAVHSTALRSAVARLRELGHFELPRYRGSSPAKRAYDRLVSRVIGHALADVVRQLEAYRTELDRVLDAVVEEIEPQTDDQR